MMDIDKDLIMNLDRNNGKDIGKKMDLIIGGIGMLIDGLDLLINIGDDLNKMDLLMDLIMLLDGLMLGINNLG